MPEINNEKVAMLLGWLPKHKDSCCAGNRIQEFYKECKVKPFGGLKKLCADYNIFLRYDAYKNCGGATVTALKSQREFLDTIDGSKRPASISKIWLKQPTIEQLLVEKPLSEPDKEECIICGEKRLRIDGLSCPGRDHFTCWECMQGYIGSIAGPGALLGKVNTDGCLRCPGTKCGHFFGGDDYRHEAPSEVFDALQNLIVLTIASREAQEAREETEERMKKEFDQINKLEGVERTAAMHRHNIVTNIMNLQCPRCNTVFVAFDGCFALTCSNNTCGAGFCAWCLQNCGTDAHEHVLVCPKGNRSHHGQIEDFEGAHRKRRKEAIEATLRPESEVVRRRVLELMKRDLEDLNIVLDL